MSLAVIRVHELVRTARSRGASDVHFGGVEPPATRIDGRLFGGDGPPVDDAGVRAFLHDVLGASSVARLADGFSVDGTVRATAPGVPYRLHAYRHAGGLRVAIRLLAENIPTLEHLGLPAAVTALSQRAAGLVVFTGPTGSGKTTALAAFVDSINRSAERHVLTVEDPVEYAHVSARSLVTQCEIGRDVATYADALRGFLRADPDVILVGEMRDRDTMAAALMAAETGHLVLSTLHTHDAPQTVDRIIDAFPVDGIDQVRAQLAGVLAGIVALRLVPRRHPGGRRAVAEVLIGTDAVRALVREGKTHQLRNAIITGRSSGMQTLETQLSDLVVRGDVELADALAAAGRPGEVRTVARAVS